MTCIRPCSYNSTIEIETHAVSVKSSTHPDALRPIAAVEDGVPPYAIVEKPSNGLLKTGLKCFQCALAEFCFNLAGIDCIVTVVSGPIFDKANQVVSWAATPWFHAVEEIADRPYDMNIGALVTPAHIVGFAYASASRDRREGACGVVDEQPVADVLSIP